MAFNPQELWERVLDAAADRIAQLALEDGLAARVKRRGLVDLSIAELPQVVVTYEGCDPEINLNSTLTDETILPVRVHVLDRRDPKDDSKRARWAGWVLVVASAFRPLATGLPPVLSAGVPECYRWDVERMTAHDLARLLGRGYQQSQCNFFVKARCFTDRLAS
jgi:hypothetical protein